jgi:hypothetical protein
MGKVTIIVESDSVDTTTLYHELKRMMPDETDIECALSDDGDGTGQDVRVYIVPDDD